MSEEGVERGVGLGVEHKLALLFIALKLPRAPGQTDTQTETARRCNDAGLAALRAAKRCGEVYLQQLGPPNAGGLVVSIRQLMS